MPSDWHATVNVELDGVLDPSETTIPIKKSLSFAELCEELVQRIPVLKNVKARAAEIEIVQEGDTISRATAGFLPFSRVIDLTKGLLVKATSPRRAALSLRLSGITAVFESEIKRRQEKQARWDRFQERKMARKGPEHSSEDLHLSSASSVTSPIAKLPIESSTSGLDKKPTRAPPPPPISSINESTPIIQSTSHFEDLVGGEIGELMYSEVESGTDTEFDELTDAVPLEEVLSGQAMRQARFAEVGWENVPVQFRRWFHKIEALLNLPLPFLPISAPSLKFAYIVLHRMFERSILEDKHDCLESDFDLDTEVFLSVWYLRNDQRYRKTLRVTLGENILDIYPMLDRKARLETPVTPESFTLKLYGKEVYFRPEKRLCDYEEVIALLPTLKHNLLTLSLVPACYDREKQLMKLQRLTELVPTLTGEQYEALVSRFQARSSMVVGHTSPVKIQRSTHELTPELQPFADQPHEHYHEFSQLEVFLMQKYLEQERTQFIRQPPFGLTPADLPRPVKAMRPPKTAEMLRNPHILSEFPNSEWFSLFETSELPPPIFCYSHTHCTEPLRFYLSSLERIDLTDAVETLYPGNDGILPAPVYLIGRISLVHGEQTKETRYFGPFPLVESFGSLGDSEIIFDTRICDLPRRSIIVATLCVFRKKPENPKSEMEDLERYLHDYSLKRSNPNKPPRKLIECVAKAKTAHIIGSTIVKLFDYDTVFQSGSDTVKVWPNLYFTDKNYIIQPMFGTDLGFDTTTVAELFFRFPTRQTNICWVVDEDEMWFRLTKKYIRKALNRKHIDLANLFQDEGFTVSHNPLARARTRPKMRRSETNRPELDKLANAIERHIDWFGRHYDLSTIRSSDLESTKNGVSKLAKLIWEEVTHFVAPSHDEHTILFDLALRRPVSKPSALEAALLWKYRHFCARDSKLFLKFCEALDYFDSTKVFEFHTILLPNWAPFIDRRMYLTLLDRPFPDEKLHRLAIDNMSLLPHYKRTDFVPQLVVLLSYQHSFLNLLFLFLWKLLNPVDMFWALTSTLDNRYHSSHSYFLAERLLWYAENSSELIEQRVMVSELEAIADVIKSRPGSEIQHGYGFPLLDELLERFNTVLPSTSLPINSKLRVRRVLKGRVMSSKKRPLWLVFENADPLCDPIELMFKKGDDCRQDSATLQLLAQFERFFAVESLPSELILYQVMSTARLSGFLEIVLNADTIARVTADYGGAFSTFSRHPFREWLRQGRNEREFETARQAFVVSMANYSAACHILGIGDRHNDNVMLHRTGPLFHIDFGHFLGNVKYWHGIKRERGPFLMTPAMREVIGDKWDEYCRLAKRMFEVLRQQLPLILAMFRPLVACEMPELVCTANLQWLVDACRPDLDRQEAEAHFDDLIQQAVNTKFTNIDHALHIMKHG